MTDIYQSPGDRLRFEILLKSLTEGSLNLAVLSDHDQVLDFYGKLFDERLRAQGETHIEFCASTNSEQLVKKFNEILSELTLNQALEKDKKHAPRRYLVFRDSILMQDFELQLLARLVNGFPAGNISVILLLNRSANYRSKLEAFGKNLLQWEVETQAGQAKKPLENWVAEPPKPTWRVPGADKPKQEPVLLPESQAVTPAAPAVSAAALSPQNLPELSREPTLLAEVVPPQAPEPALVFERPARKTPWGLITLAVLLSIAAYGYMYRDALLDEVELMKKYLLRGTPAVATPAEDAASAAALSAQALASAEALQAAASAASAAEPVASTASAAVGPVVAAEPAASAPAPAPAVVASSALASAKPLDKASDKPAEKAVAAKPSEPNALSEATDEEWLKQLPPNSWVVQLAAFDTEKEVVAFKRSHKLYASARIMTPRKKGGNKRYFILVSGPFASKSEADAYMQSSPLLGKAWLRGSQSLKTQFE
ncbi:SPOR domain-containing protein [Limnohabitans sp. JirII-31]|uniref:SPOR domain-containing protein n=1 Tax=Limnohabitans sp. JirII-31 TaxID=1977908 RepID=UPI000C1F5469|nr:SPOR domain-containing protein [Limnohabitans sp. JirII-31]PIT79863.1 hypothetical protein B9Z41_04590 [Limnohabitans sp. JirII-31]